MEVLGDLLPVDRGRQVLGDVEELAARIAPLEDQRLVVGDGDANVIRPGSGKGMRALTLKVPSSWGPASKVPP